MDKIGCVIVAVGWLLIDTAGAHAEPPASTIEARSDAAPPAQQDSERAPTHVPPTSNEVPYRIGLGLSYAVAPSLVIVSGVAALPGAGFASIPLGLLGAPLFHLVAGERRLALRALIGIPLCALAGGFIGGLIGLPIGAALNAGDSDEGDDLAGLSVAVSMIGGAMVGAGAGYLGWAIYDLVTMKREPRQRPRRTAQAVPALAPLLAVQLRTDTPTASLAGFVAGVQGRL